MNIGRLRERITIQSSTAASDSAGGQTLTWANLATAPTVWARVEPLQGREVVKAMQIQGPFTHRVTLRYRTDLTLAMRVLWGSRYLNVRAILSNEQRAFTQMLCEEGVGA